MNFLNSDRKFAEKQTTEFDLDNVYIISKDIHESILIIVDNALSQLLELYDPYEIDDDILLMESESIAEQTIEQLKKASKIEIKEKTLYYIKHSVSCMIIMKFINDIEPYLSKFIGEINE